MRSRHDRLYHLALAADWETARAGGNGYRTSTLGLDLVDVGFVHCSYADQVRGVADRVYRDRDDVLLLAIDQDRLTSRVVDEPPEGTEAEASGADDEFPHVYGPVDLDAVVEVTPLDLRPDGTLDLPPIDAER